MKLNNNIKIQTWFPTTIFSIENLISVEENINLIKEIYKIKKNIKTGGKNWKTDTYNSCGTYNLIKDIKFNNLIKKTEEQTLNFSKILGSNETYKVCSGWFNYYNKGDYQEYHIHPSSHFSAVYFFKNPKGSGSLIFKNPSDKMFPLKNLKYNEFSYGTCSYNPPERSLIIFQSDLWHMVEKCKNTTPRITAAFNLI
jgi:uncharacterized protein (TIGR02466 family)